MHRRLMAAIVLALTPTIAWSQDTGEKPVLVLDSGGHTAMVMEVMFTPDGRQLITVSHDKTIRIWDAQSGEPVRVLRPAIGVGPYGKLYCAALSPDGKLLAVAGFASEDGVRVISLADGRLVQSLRGHENGILGVAFSPDGRYLASASFDKTVRVWNLATGATEQILRGHTDSIYGVCFSPDGRHVASASYDGTARIYATATGRTEQVLRGHTAEVSTVAWSPDGRLLATGSNDQTIRFWNPQTGRLVKTITELGKRSVTTVAFSPDSKKLLYTEGVGGGLEYGAGVVEVASGRIVTHFDKHTNIVMCCAFSPDGRLAATGNGDDREIFVWRVSDGSVVHKLVGKGRTVWSTGWSPDGKSIAFSTEWQGGNILRATTPLDRTFDLTALDFGAAPTKNFIRAQLTLGNLALNRTSPTTIDVLRNGQTTATINLNPYYDGNCRSMTLLPGNRVVVGTDYGVHLYNALTGEEIRELKGHTGEVWAVSPSPNGRYVLSASSDQTLRIWDPDKQRPLLTLFIAGNEWIAWTEEGYYAASAGGERLMGWHVNNGPNRMASFFPAVQFRKSLFRPDAIKLILQAGSVEAALQIASHRKGGNPQDRLPRDTGEVLPPTVLILSPEEREVTVEKETIKVVAVALSRSRHPVTSMQLLLNGRPYQGDLSIRRFDNPKPGQVRAEWSVALSPGRHVIAVRADSAVSNGVSLPIEVKYVGGGTSEDVLLPSLYVLAIGVSDYDDEKLRLNYAAADAKAIEAALRRHARPLFRKVEVRLVTDKQATQRGILRGLTWLRQQMTQHDVGIVFFSGHGEKDADGTFYLLPADVETDDLLATGVPGTRLKSVLGSTPGRLILMLDACHSGAGAADTTTRRKAALTDNLVRDLVTEDYGVIVMASSTGREFSEESNRHRMGYFTVALTEGMAGRADYNKDGAVYINELDLWVAERVKELTRGRQHPVTAKPGSLRSFPLVKAAP